MVTFNGGLKYVGEENKTKVKHSEPFFSVEIKNNEGEVIFSNKVTNFN